MPAVAATHQENRHTNAHYRVVNGKVIFVHDYHANHAIAATSREAHLHERSTIVDGRPTRIRSTNGADTRELMRLADRHGIRYTRTRAGGNHHGRQGAYDVLDFETAQDARALLNAVAFHGGFSQEAPPPTVNTVPMAAAPVRPTRARTAPARPVVPLATPAPAVAPAVAQSAPVATGPTETETDDQFASIFGQRLETPGASESDIDDEFAKLFGAVRVAGGMFGGNPIPQTEPLSRAICDAVTRECAARGMTFRFTDGFINGWNLHCKSDIRQWIEDCFVPWGPGLKLAFDGSSSSLSFGGDPALPGKIGTFQRNFNFSNPAEKSVYHAYLITDDSVQGSGYSEAFLAHSMDYYRAWGLHHADVTAACGGGGFAWSRYGFVPRDNSCWRSQQSQIQARYSQIDFDQHIVKRQRELQAATSAGNQAKMRSSAHKLQQAQEAKAIWANPTKRREFEALVAKTNNYAQWEVADHPLGQFFMPGTNFGGRFLVGDDRHLQRMLKYTKAKAARRSA
jgi:hypothetical protein